MGAKTTGVDQAFVQTVLGPISPDDLGHVLSHEHVFVDWDYARGLSPQLASVAPLPKALRRLREATEVGIGSLIDCSPEQFAASPLLLRAAAVESDVNIIASTGIFNADSLPVPGWAYSPGTIADITANFVGAIRTGLRGSGVRPGMVKIATSGRAINQVEENALRAAAAAQLQTGIGIITHTELSLHGDQQIDILLDAGAAADRTIIGHMGWGSKPDDRDMHLGLAERGFTLGFDCMGSPDVPAEDWVTMIYDLIKAGFERQVVISHDTMVHNVGLETVWGEGWASGDLTYASKTVIPGLLDAGASQTAIDAILIENPRRILTIDPARYPGAVAFAAEL